MMSRWATIRAGFIHDCCQRVRSSEQADYRPVRFDECEFIVFVLAVILALSDGAETVADE